MTRRGELSKTTETRSSRFRADIQGLRGVAVLLVVIYHTGLGIPGGFVGVDVFFVISGFVITRGLLRELEETNRIDLLSFYRRRIRRLLPALAIMLAVVSALSAVVLSPFAPIRYFLTTALAASLSLSNFWVYESGGGYFSPIDESNPFIHTWSLAIEEQFYLVFPIAMLGAWALGRRTRAGEIRTLVLCLSTAGVASLLGSALLAYGTILDPETASRFSFYLPFTRLWEFIAGILLAIFLAQSERRPQSVVPGLAGAALLAYASFGFDSSTVFPGVAATIPVLSAVLLMASENGPASRILASRPLVRLGDLSYSWYLWHWPLIVFAQSRFAGDDGAVALAAALSLIPAVVSYRYVEHRFRHPATKEVEHRSSPFAQSRLLALSCIAIPIVIAQLSLATSSTNFGLQVPDEVHARSRAHERGCLGQEVNLADCTFGPDGSPVILLLGDSHASAAANAVVSAGLATGHQVVVSSMSACPFLTVERPEFDRSCHEKQQSDLDLLTDLEPQKIVIANRSTVHAARIEAGPGQQIGEDFEPPSAEAVDEWAAAVASTVETISTFTDEVFVLAVVPHFAAAEFDSALPTLLTPDGANPRLSPEAVDDIRGGVVAAEAAALAPSGAVLLEPTGLLCASDGCPMRDGDLFLYYDHQHLSTVGAEHLRPLFADAFES